MSLRDAQPIDGLPLPVLEGTGPVPCVKLNDWVNRRFTLPPGDPELLALHDGAPASIPALDNLVGMRRWWFEHPDWMDFLHPDSPGHKDKLLERALYLEHWAEFIPPGCRVMDLGGGIGRFTQWCLDQGCEVELVDPDLRSIWMAVKHAAGRDGRLDVHWSLGEQLPNVEPVDVVIAAEVLCYVPDPKAVMRAIHKVLKPGGRILASVEARYGWAMGPDVAEGSLTDLFDGGIVHVPGDRWVRTFTEADFQSLLEGMTVKLFEPSHYVLSGPFEAAAGAADLQAIKEFEIRLRADPITRPLHRAWMAAAVRDG
ncbi:MAG: class I SAM-dependent methyltransferase [Myxococcota bacterium]